VPSSYSSFSPKERKAAGFRRFNDDFCAISGRLPGVVQTGAVQPEKFSARRQDSGRGLRHIGQNATT